GLTAGCSFSGYARPGFGVPMEHALVALAFYPCTNLCRVDSLNASSFSVDEALARVFGFDELRPAQREALDAVLGGRDTVLVLSTGGGKSLVYQLAALALDGTAIVVSP